MIDPVLVIDSHDNKKSGSNFQASLLPDMPDRK